MARRVTGGMEVTGGIKALKHGGKDRRRDSSLRTDLRTEVRMVE